MNDDNFARTENNDNSQWKTVDEIYESDKPPEQCDCNVFLKPVDLKITITE